MPNVFGTVASAPIITAALALAVASRPLLSSISLDLSQLDPAVARTAKLNSTITARINTIPAVIDYAEGTMQATAADTDIPVIMDQMKQTSRSFTPAEINACFNADGSGQRNIILEAATPLAEAIAAHIVDLIVSKWTHANFPHAVMTAPGTSGGVGGRYVKAAASWDYAAVVDTRTIAAVKKMPKAGRFLCLNSVGFGSLIKDSTIAQRYALNTQPSVEGSVPNFAGFSQICEHSDLNTANATANLVGFFGSRDSVIYASRVPTNPADIPGVNPGKSSYSYEIITEPKTGISVMVIEWAGELSYNVKLVWLQGCAVGNPVNGCMITSA